MNMANKYAVLMQGMIWAPWNPANFEKFGILGFRKLRGGGEDGEKRSRGGREEGEGSALLLNHFPL